MTTEGRPVLVGLEPGASESTDAWSGFLPGMVSRRLRPPLLVISDGAAGLIAAVELVFPHSLASAASFTRRLLFWDARYGRREHYRSCWPSRPVHHSAPNWWWAAV